jgi:L-lysine 2,3-aminomutase
MAHLLRPTVLHLPVRPYQRFIASRTSIAKGIEIIEGRRGHTTGYALPQFVIDAPDGGGKVPINPGYMLSHDNEKISTNRDLPSIHELDVWCDDDGISVFQSLPHFDSGFRS